MPAIGCNTKLQTHRDSFYSKQKDAKYVILFNHMSDRDQEDRSGPQNVTKIIDF
jgi:hypothetical protein